MLFSSAIKMSENCLMEAIERWDLNRFRWCIERGASLLDAMNLAGRGGFLEGIRFYLESRLRLPVSKCELEDEAYIGALIGHQPHVLHYLEQRIDSNLPRSYIMNEFLSSLR